MHKYWYYNSLLVFLKIESTKLMIIDIIVSYFKGRQKSKHQ